MKVGFTGTRSGMTKAQAERLPGLFQILEISELHYGDCLGSDEQAYNIVLEKFPHAKLICHPPDHDQFRAFTNRYDTIYKLKPYLERNKDIVDDSDVLVATPKEDEHESRRSGTWSTIRYAKSLDRIVIIVDSYGIVNWINHGEW